MNGCNGFTECLVARAALYRWLSRLFKAEVDSQLLSLMKSMRFPAACGDFGLQAAYEKFQFALADLDADRLNELAADFACCFLGAGIAKGSDAAAFPYASVYTDPRRIVMQQARDRAVAAYGAYGLQVDGQSGNLPEDHLAYLLEFMAVLCQAALSAASTDELNINGHLAVQRQFLQDHLLNWVKVFCDDLERHARTPFYQSVSQITRCWLDLEDRSLGSLTA